MKILQLRHKVRSMVKEISLESRLFSLALSTLKTNKGYALADILTELHRYVHKSKWRIGD